MPDENNTFVNSISQSTPDRPDFVVSPMVANVPCSTSQGGSGKWYAFNFPHIHESVYGVGDTEDEARADFYRAVLKRYQDLTVIDDNALTLSEARELEYLRSCRGQADAESGRDGGR